MKMYSDPIRIVKGFLRKPFSQSPFTIQSFTNQIGLLYQSWLGSRVSNGNIYLSPDGIGSALESKWVMCIE